MQQQGETLREYVKRFNKAMLVIDEVDDQVIMTTFQAGFVRTYVFLMLRTYVMILCNWLIL